MSFGHKGCPKVPRNYHFLVPILNVFENFVLQKTSKENCVYHDLAHKKCNKTLSIQNFKQKIRRRNGKSV